MQLIHLKTIELPEPVGDQDTSDIYYEHQDLLYDMKNSGSVAVARITLRDGKTHWAAPVNLNGGRCDCCGAFSSHQIKKIEYFGDPK